MKHCAGLLAILLSVASSSLTAQQKPLFTFHSNAWVNLHHYVRANARGGPAATGLTDAEQKVWAEGVEFYKPYAVRDVLRDDGMVAIQSGLRGAEGQNNLDGIAIDAALKPMLERIMPVYQKRRSHVRRRLHGEDGRTLDAASRRKALDPRRAERTRRRVQITSDTMILTSDVLRREIAAGRVVIDPFFPDQVGPASIDLHLGDEIRVMHTGREPVPVTDEVDYRTITDVRSLATPYPLAPGETIHGITRERITLPGDIGGWLEGRSRFARLGLMVHVTSGFVQPGVSNRQVLEMSNVSDRTLLIHAGVRLLQIVLQRCEGSASYQGRFARQDNL